MLVGCDGRGERRYDSVEYSADTAANARRAAERARADRGLFTAHGRSGSERSRDQFDYRD